MKVDINNLSATVEEMMIKASNTQPKENQKHKSKRKRKSKPELIRNGEGQKRRSVRNGGQGNNHTFRRRTKNHPQRRKKTRQKPPQRREIQMNKLLIQNGFKGIQKATISLIMHGITLSIRSIDRANQALKNVPKVLRPK